MTGRKAKVALALLTAGLLAWGAWERRYYAITRNFGVVEPGKIYRGGYQCPMPLSRILKKYGIRTVLCLRSAKDDWNAAERKLLADRGVRVQQVVLNGGGEELLAGLQQAAAILADPANQPVFVHCWAGKHRTGSVVAVYRIRHGGWTKEDAHAELDRWEVPRDGPYSWPHQVLDLDFAQAGSAGKPL